MDIQGDRISVQSQALNGIGKDFLHGHWKLYILFLLLAQQKHTSKRGELIKYPVACLVVPAVEVA